jgi:hypothetical protein
MEAVEHAMSADLAEATTLGHWDSGGRVTRSLLLPLVGQGTSWEPPATGSPS